MGSVTRYQVETNMEITLARLQFSMGESPLMGKSSDVHNADHDHAG